jgi:hypothetical protein
LLTISEVLREGRVWWIRAVHIMVARKQRERKRERRKREREREREGERENSSHHGNQEAEKEKENAFVVCFFQNGENPLLFHLVLSLGVGAAHIQGRFFPP